MEFEPTSSQPVILYEAEKELTTPEAETSPSGLSFGKNFTPIFQSTFKNAWLPALIILICSFLWIGFDSLRLNRIDPSQAIQLLYQRLRRLARPVTGHASKDQTAHSFSQALIERLSAIKTSTLLQNWLSPAQNEIIQFTELFSRSLFASSLPSRAEAKDAIKTWSRLKWRLLLANVLRNKNK